MKLEVRVRFLLFVVLILMSVTVAGCAGEEATPEGSTAAVSPLPQKPSRPSVADDSPLSAPPSEPIDFDVKPAPGKAVLKGQIELTMETILIGELFLATAVPTSNPEIDLLDLDTEAAPKAAIDRSTWQFIYVDIEPGKYGIIVWEPLSSAPVNDPETGKTLYIELSPDQIADIGVLKIP
jgi:hypothetical protein